MAGRPIPTWPVGRAGWHGQDRGLHCSSFDAMKRAVERWRSHKIIGRDASEGEGAGWDGTMRPVAVGTEIEKMKTRMFGQLIHQRACRTGEVGGASGQRHYR